MPSSSSSSSSRSSSRLSSRSSRSSSRSSSPASSCASPPPSISAIEQYELDADGKPIRTFYGYKPTARMATLENLTRGIELDELDPRAFDTLPPDLLVYPKKPHNNRKHFHFGVGVSYERLWEYCIARDLVPRHYHTDSSWSGAMIEAAVKQLDRVCGAQLQLCNIANVEHEFVLSRYSNYTWFSKKLSESDELEVVDIIHKELGICDPPRWYHKLVQCPSGRGFF